MVSKGFSLPFLIILTLFLALPVVFFVFYSNENSSNVKGVSKVRSGNGMHFTISSKNGTWDLFEYVCKTRNECLYALHSGVKAEVLSGGPFENYSVSVEYKNEWNDYEFMKIFVKSGWGSPFRLFSIESVGDVMGSSVEKISDGDSNYSVVVLPLKEIKSGFFKSAVFTD